jgi:hypothetical protein
VQNKKCSGRPKRFTESVEKHMDMIMRRHPEATSTTLKDKLVKRFGKAFERSGRSIRLVRRLLGYTPPKGIGQDDLSAVHKQQRVSYCKRHLKDKFLNVVFTDEKPFVLGKIRGALWRAPGADRPTF